MQLPKAHCERLEPLRATMRCIAGPRELDLMCVVSLPLPARLRRAQGPRMSAPDKLRDGLHIVVTDHDPDSLLHLTTPLREAGHCVFAAYDGDSAFELVCQLPQIDLLITNTRLAGLDGAKLMRQTRQRLPELPILHVAHRPQEADITPPGVPTLSEPFTPNQLLLAVRSLLTNPKSRGF